MQWVEAEVDKDWEIACVNRWIFRGLEEEKRFGIGYRRIKGFQGVRFVAGVIGASTRHIATAVETEPEPLKILEKTSRGMAHPIPPTVVSGGPCKEVVLRREKADLSAFPIVTWTPTRDPAPFLTPLWFTLDPDTKVRNVAMYRCQIKGPRRTGIWTVQQGYRHIQKWFAKGEDAPAAMVVGADPAIYMTGVSRLPEGEDEVAAAGGIRGEPVQLVRAETVEIDVPATAELVIEGFFRRGTDEPEGPFGEFSGYMAASPFPMPVFEVTCITHRRDPILQGIISQFPPSESSMMRKTFYEASAFKRLHYDHGLRYVQDYHIPESGGAWGWHWIRISKRNSDDASRLIHILKTDASLPAPKWWVICDHDVQIRDPFAREWALAFRLRPAEDITIIPEARAMPLDPSAARPGEIETLGRGNLVNSRVIVDATCKWPYPALSLPPMELLYKVREQWPKYGLPSLEKAYFPVEAE